MRRLAMILCSAVLAAQTPPAGEEPIRIRPGVTPPRLLKKIEPEYTTEARQQFVQGTILLDLVVGADGLPANIKVLSPLGFGLDERAVEAVTKWRFAPGTKDGKPVVVGANIEVNFRFPLIWYDERAERQRTDFNRFTAVLNGPKPRPADLEKAVAAMQRLAAQNFVPAMHVLGTWKRTGKYVARDETGGWELIRKAAAKNHGPAIYELARAQLEKDPESSAALDEMRRAALLGSLQAQFVLASRAERGAGEPRDDERARRYFRLCAAAKVPECQMRLGRLLLAKNPRESEKLQAIAWLELAADAGMAEARTQAEAEIALLTPEQVAWVRRLKEQLTPNQLPR